MESISPVMVPVTAMAYAALEKTLVKPDDPHPVNHELAVNGMRVRGRWHVVAVRADYTIGGERTYWVTFAWAGDA